MTTNAHSLRYPRRVLQRFFLDGVGRLILAVFTRLHVEGLENIPKTGPVILAANHVSVPEPMLLAILPKRQVELIGASDIVYEPFYKIVTDAYGYIHMDRGSLDRENLRNAIGILEQGGILGIFPEGGTWSPGRMVVHPGVAMLSERCQAPVVPVGFSGFNDSMGRIVRLERPRLTMRVGKPLPPMNFQDSPLPRKEALNAYAQEIMQAIRPLINDEDYQIYPVESLYSMSIQLGDEELADFPGQAGLAQFLHQRIIVETLAINLHLGTATLYSTPENPQRQNSVFLRAMEDIIKYLEEKPTFFQFRMGKDLGEQTIRAILALRELLLKAQMNGQTVYIHSQVEHHFRDGRVELEKNDYEVLPD